MHVLHVCVCMVGMGWGGVDREIVFVSIFISPKSVYVCKSLNASMCNKSALIRHEKKVSSPTFGRENVMYASRKWKMAQVIQGIFFLLYFQQLHK